MILFYVGLKMIVSEWYHVPTPISLGFIALVLAVTVYTSLRTGGGDKGALGGGAASAEGGGQG